MVEPSQFQVQWDVITSAPVVSLLAVAGVWVVVWGMMWQIYQGEIRAKDAEIAAKNAALAAKDATIESLRTQLQDKRDPIASLMRTKGE